VCWLPSPLSVPLLPLCTVLWCCAAMVAAELASRGVKLELVVDEGTSIVMDGLPPLYSSPVALIATVEKMYMQVEVRVGPWYTHIHSSNRQVIRAQEYVRPGYTCAHSSSYSELATVACTAGPSNYQHVQHLLS
jgi:hypothetical protein